MSTEVKKEGGMIRFARAVERVGNKLPHPMYIFLYLLIAVMIISAICSVAGVSVTYMAAAKDGTVAETTVAVKNLLSRGELQNFLANIISAYQSNTMLIPMLVCAMCMAVAEETGFFEAALRKLLLGAPRGVATYALCVVGVCSNICSDAGMILAPAIGAVLFKALGRNPWIGISVGYGASAAGFTANLLPATTDALLSGISAQLAIDAGTALGKNYVVHAMSNYIFLFAATWVVALGLTFVCEKFVAPVYGDKKAGSGDDAGLKKFALTDAENKGLKHAMIGLLIFVVVLVLGCLPVANFPFLIGFFRSVGGKIVGITAAPIMKGIVPLIGIFFLCIGIPYGYGSGKIKKKGDIPKMIQKGVIKMSGLVFIVFPCSLFIYEFNRCGLSTVISIGGERLLRAIGLTGFPMLVVYILVIAVINIFMYSGSAKWMILAPIFIPMFANMGIHPALTQLAYRIGDSSTNNLTPLNACLLAVIALMEQYRDPEINSEEPGMGTVLSTQLPISIATLVCMIGLLGVFYFFNLPIGIGV
ncbi:MAG: AbgT family transporter [Oscillospiraceae bacterium]